MILPRKIETRNVSEGQHQLVFPLLTRRVTIMRNFNERLLRRLRAVVGLRLEAGGKEVIAGCGESSSGSGLQPSACISWHDRLAAWPSSETASVESSVRAAIFCTASPVSENCFTAGRTRTSWLGLAVMHYDSCR